MTVPNLPPIADAGPDVQLVLTSPSQTLLLDGTRSRDPEGGALGARWRQEVGPTPAVIANPNSLATLVSGLVVGSYRFALTVTDNRGASARDTMTATVTVPANQGPVADAGAAVQVLLAAASVSVTLDGSSSTDPDGTLAVFAWTQLSGPASATIATPGNAMTTAQLTAPGAYEFELRVTDDRGASARDTVVVTVTTPAAPCGPIAQAGRDVMILWPANATVLDGSASSAPEGAIIAYAWEQVAGPAAGCATGHDRARLTLTGLARGVYRFRLTVTDARGRTASDEVHVAVERRRP